MQNSEEEFQKELMEKINSDMGTDERIEIEFEKINKNIKQKKKLKKEILKKEKIHNCQFIMLLCDSEVITFIFVRKEEYMTTFYMEVCMGHQSSKFSASDSSLVREFDKLQKSEKFQKLILKTEEKENIRFIEFNGKYLNDESNKEYEIYGQFKKGNDMVSYKLDLDNVKFILETG